MSVDDLLFRWSESPRARSLLVPLARAYVRYWPIRAGKPALWTRVVDPYLAWHPRRFRARTIFGFSLEGDSKDLIQQWIYYFGIWEPWLTTFVHRRLKPGDTFVDVGANIGYYALLASTLVGRTGSSVAIEASPSIHDSLRRNVSINHADNVRTVNAAALGTRSVVKLYRGNAANSGETTLLEDYAGELECEVAAAPLQELLTPVEIETVRLIKIDTEGAEFSILSGFDGFDRLRRDVELVVEVHPTYLARRGESLDGVLAVMDRAGFVPYVLDEEFWPPGYLQGVRAVQPPVRFRSDRMVEDGTVFVFSRIAAPALE